MGLPIFIFSSFRLKKVSPLSHVTTAISEQPCSILYILSQFQVSDNDKIPRLCFDLDSP